MSRVDEVIRLLPVRNTFAAGTLTLAGNAVAAETVTIGTHVYTWRAAVGATADEVKVGASASDSLDNLIAAINGAAGGGSTYGSATVAHATVTAAAGAGDTMVVTTTTEGPAGNLIATTETMTNGSWGATTLRGGGATSSTAPSVTSKTNYKKRPFYADEALCLVESHAGSGTMTAPVYIWGWNEAKSRGYCIGALNGGTAIPEAAVAADKISYSELLVGIGKYTHFYAQLDTLGGTGTEVEISLDFVRPGAHD